MVLRFASNWQTRKIFTQEWSDTSEQQHISCNMIQIRAATTNSSYGVVSPRRHPSCRVSQTPPTAAIDSVIQSRYWAVGEIVAVNVVVIRQATWSRLLGE